uniref:uncharacterized protein isoform X2 n=1 Tax=Pristiophorus japonicus TaxID=55135 RepID=UPI00398E4D4C
MRSVLVTGANRGLGLELIRQLAKAERPPRCLLAGCRDPDGSRAKDLKDMAKSFPNIKIFKLDVDNFDSIQECADQILKVLENNGLNLLINNAGINFGGGLNEVTPETMMQSYRTNVVGPMMVTKALLPVLQRAAQLSDELGISCKKAAVINMSSILASIELLGETAGKVYPYRASKAPLTTEESVQGILRVLSKLSDKDTGSFLDWRGQRLPW